MASKGGYHHFEVIEGHAETLGCVYCHGLLKDAKELPCGHLICEVCLQTINQANESYCPLPSCEEIFEQTQVHDSKYANRLVSNLKVSCLKKEFGCDWKGSIADYFKTHEGVCDKSEEKKILEDVLKEMKQANLKINKLNEELKQAKEENQNTVENLRREVDELKQEIHEYKKKYENQIEDKHNITNQPQAPAFRLKEQLMVSGLEKFID